MRILVLIVMSVIPLCGAGPATANEDAFRSCCARSMALQTMRNQRDNLPTERIIDEVLTDCIFQMPPEVALKRESKQWMAQAKKEIANEIKSVRAQAEAERAAEERAGSEYFSCLEQAAQSLARGSDEAADIVAQASMAACPAKREALYRIRREHDDAWDDRSMRAMDETFVHQILLLIVAERSKHHEMPQQSPDPSEHKTPI